MKTLNTTNVKKHISYLAADDVAEICRPLFETFNLNGFAYTKTYSDYSYINLTSYRKASYYALKMQYPITGTIVSSKIHLWKNLFSQEAVKDVATLFNLHNGIVICHSTKAFKECMTFAAPQENHSVIDFYFNNIDLLEQFGLYFKDKAAKLIKQAYKERYIIPINMCGTSPKSRSYEEFSRLIKAKKIYMSFYDEEVIFSRREYECLMHLARGRTMKETAQLLNLSPRTVEYYVTNAKNKTKFTIRQLLDRLRDDFLF